MAAFTRPLESTWKLVEQPQFLASSALSGSIGYELWISLCSDRTLPGGVVILTNCVPSTGSVLGPKLVALAQVLAPTSVGAFIVPDPWSRNPKEGASEISGARVGVVLLILDRLRQS